MSTASLEDLRRDCEAATPQPYWREPGNSNALGIAQALGAVSAERQRRELDEAKAFLSLALAQRRQSHVYRQWALEEDKPDRAEHYRNEADRYIRNARWHLSLARARGI